MQDNRDDYEPIIATRPNRRPLREQTQPLWRLVLALGGGLAVVVLLAWWYMGKSSNDGASAPVQPESPPPEIRVEQPFAPPARDSEVSADVIQAPAPPARAADPAASAEQGAVSENVPEVVPDESVQAPAPAPPALVSLRFTSPDTQVQFEVRGPLDSSPPLASKAGDVVDLVPGTYRVVASGTQLETLEREIMLTGGRPAEFIVELCAQPKQELGNLAGQVVEQRACRSTVECESMFTVLSEQAEQLVKDRAFRAQQCANWRATSAPDGRWTLDTKCDGEASTTTCRIEITEGACTVTGPRRSVRGEACPRAELN
jgi:hypothetical protein